MDYKSDIYSIGKIIDYVFNVNLPEDKNYPLLSVVEKCTRWEKSMRYDSIDEIINDIRFILSYRDDQEEKKLIIEGILNGEYTADVNAFIISQTANNRLSNFIVQYKLYSFGQLIIKFSEVDQEDIIDSIYDGFIEATGYGGGNYDIFASM